jgi:hypothetical protein
VVLHVSPIFLSPRSVTLEPIQEHLCMVWSADSLVAISMSGTNIPGRGTYLRRTQK